MFQDIELSVYDVTVFKKGSPGDGKKREKAFYGWNILHCTKIKEKHLMETTKNRLVTSRSPKMKSQECFAWVVKIHFSLAPITHSKSKQNKEAFLSQRKGGELASNIPDFFKYCRLTDFTITLWH